MRIKPSLDGKSKHLSTDRSVSDSRWSRAKRRRRPQMSKTEPQKTDSTIATVTLFISGKGAGEGVKIVKNAAAADIAIDLADVDNPDSLRLRGLQQKRKPTYQKEDDPVEITSDIADESRTKRKSYERYSKTKPETNNDDTIAVFDLEDQANLPVEVLDILSCKGGDLCFHDHNRFRIVGNKIHVMKKGHSSHKNRGKKLISPRKLSPRLHIQAKKVIFSPTKKLFNFQKSRKPPASPRQKVNPAECHKVPPPPAGYHTRIDPSSPDSCPINSSSEYSTWTHTHQETALDFSKTSKVDSRAKSPHKKQCIFTKDTQDHVQRAPKKTKCRFAQSASSKTDRHRFDLDRVSPTSERKRRQCSSPVKSDIPSCGACGDTLRNNLPYKRNQKNDQEQLKDHTKNNNEESCADVRLELTRSKLNERHSGYTAWLEKDKNENNNCPRLDMLSDCSKKSIYINHDLSNTLHLLSLNINMNAVSFIDSDPENVPNDIEETPLAQNPSSTTPSVDQFYTAETVSPGGLPEVTSEATPAECVEELCEGQLQEGLPKLDTEIMNSPVNVIHEMQEQEFHVESEQECWESKKHSIMMACNEAIKNRLQRQEMEEEESKEITTSESASANPSYENRKKRKTKTTESVYVKFKTSLSKKMTTTTTVKEIKQQPYGTSAKTMMVESDYQNILALPPHISEQSLSVPQPRHTRIVKCGEAESHLKKRKLSSDTEVELMHLSESNKQATEVFKDVKDSFIRDRQVTRKENTYLETPMVEVYYADVDRQDFSQRSPHQNLSLGNGELIGECDKLSEKASAITVINVADQPNDASRLIEVLSHEKNEEERNPKEKTLDKENMLLVGSAESFTLETISSTEKAKNKNKISKRDKKKSELRKLASKAKNNVEVTEINEAINGPQSETSLAHTSKKLPSTSKVTHSTIRSHSSPPESRKKKTVTKKKRSLHLLEPSETDSKSSHKARKKSPDKKKKKVKTKSFKGETAVKTVSTSSTNSEKRRKSHTTASITSINSVEDDTQTTEKALPGQERAASEIKVPQSSPQVKSLDQSLGSQEDTLTLQGQNEICNEMTTHNFDSTKIEVETKNDIQSVNNLDGTRGKAFEEAPQPIEAISKTAQELSKQPLTETTNVSKTVKKVGTKTAITRVLSSKQPKEKDLQKAEEGWNYSTFCANQGNTKVSEAKSKSVTKKPKLKYVLIKAKDKNKEKQTQKAEQPRANQTKNQPKDQITKPDAQGDNSLRGQSKTVQFSESIDKMEDIKQTDIMEELEPNEEQAQEGHIGDNASDGTIGDVFITNNFDLVRELVEEEAEILQRQSEQQEPAPKVESIAQPEKQKKRNRRPMWLKKAVPKPVEDPIVLETKTVTSKQSLSPKRLEKKKESFEEIILKPNKCNIQVTNPLSPTGLCPKGEVPSVKARVAYSSMLSNVFLSLPLKKGAKRYIAESGSPVDIKEVIEGSSVDAADYAKNLRYPSNTKRISGIVSAGPGRKKGSLEPRSRSPADVLVGSSSSRSLLSRDSDADHILTAANCSFSTDLDEASVYRRGQTRSLRNKEPRSASGRRASCVLPWHLVGEGRYQGTPESNDITYLRVAGDMAEPGILNIGLSWLMQEFFNRFDFLNPRRHLRPLSLRQTSEISIDPPSQEHQVFAAV